jgi:hypothetical protein
VQILTPESVGIYDVDRRRFNEANEYGIFAFNNDNITGKIKYTDFDYLSSALIDKDSNNDITLLLSSFAPSNVRKVFYQRAGTKGFIFPNDYPAGSMVVSDGTNILNYLGNWARFSNQGEFEGIDPGYEFYFLYMKDLFKLYEKVMQVFQGTLYPKTASSTFSIINTFVDSTNNDGIILLPSKIENNYSKNFIKIDAFEIVGVDKNIGFITIPVGNLVPPNDPDVGEG